MSLQLILLGLGLSALLPAQGLTSAVRSVKDFGAVGDGVHDDLAAIKQALTVVEGTNQMLFFPGGTYGVSNTVMIPNKTQIFGVGRGDAGAFNTVIKALPHFPKGGVLVQMGPAPGPDFGIQVKNMTIDGSSLAGNCLENLYAEELSYGQDLLLTQCTGHGLYVASNAAQNSGPFRNLEIYPSGGAGSVCIAVEGVIAFRGIEGVTCNGASSGTLTTGLFLDGAGVYSDIHVEHAQTGIALGSHSNTADGMVIMNGQFGPNVGTGVFIDGRGSYGGNQNLTLMGLLCAGCKNLLQDDVMNVRNNHYSLGLYAVGDGAWNSKTMFSNAQGIRSENY